MKNEDQSYEEKCVMRCVIWNHLYNLKNVKITRGGVLLLVKLLAKSQKIVMKYLKIRRNIEFNLLILMSWKFINNSYNKNNNEKFCNVYPDLISFNIMPSQESEWVAVPTSNVECSLLPNNQFYKIYFQFICSFISLFCYERSNRM